MKQKLLFRAQSSQQLIEVWQQQTTRTLCIDSIEQTRLNSHQLNTLMAAPNHAFLTCLLFIEPPESVLLAGSGGGELARYLNHKCPHIKGVAVEIDPLIVRLSKQFFQFPQANWDLQCADIRNIDEGCYDLIVSDIAENTLTPRWLTDTSMIKQFKQQLAHNGVLALNLLVADADSFSRTLQTLRALFNKRVLCLSLAEHKNIIVFAFKGQPQYSSIDELTARVDKVKKDWGLDFSNELIRLQTDNPSGSGIF